MIQILEVKQMLDMGFSMAIIRKALAERKEFSTLVDACNYFGHAGF